MWRNTCHTVPKACGLWYTVPIGLHWVNWSGSRLLCCVKAWISIYSVSDGATVPGHLKKLYQGVSPLNVLKCNVQFGKSLEVLNFLQFIFQPYEKFIS